MATSIKRIKIDENNNGFAESPTVTGEGSLLVDLGQDNFELQESIKTGIGILTVDTIELLSGSFTVSPPDSVGNNLDDYLELDVNNDLTFK